MMHLTVSVEDAAAQNTQNTANVTEPEVHPDQHRRARRRGNLAW